MQRTMTARPVGSLTRLLRSHAELRWGLGGLAVFLAAVLVIVGLSVIRVDEVEYRAQVSDAGSIRAGDDVRVAGVPVGEVTQVVLGDDHADVRFTARSSVFVGAESTLAVRMLTVVGGHYLALEPAGNAPLGSATIPVERVTLPYSLVELFQDAVTPLDEIDAGPLRRTFASVKTSADDSTGSIRDAIAATDSIVTLLDRQNADISRTLAVADEYLGAVTQARGVVKDMIDSWNILETLVEQSLAKVGQTLGTVATVLARLSPLGREWDARFRPMAVALSKSVPPLEELADTWGRFLISVQRLGDQIRPLAGADAAPELCVPTPERAC